MASGKGSPLSWLQERLRVHHRRSPRLSQEHDNKVFTCLLAALGVTLSRYADKGDLCVGTTTCHRLDVELEPLKGARA